MKSNWQKIKEFLFQNKNIRQTIAKNTFWLAVSNMGGRLLRAVIIIYSARVLGAAEWGLFSYAVTLVAFLTIFIDLGINPILTREASKASTYIERSKILSTAFVIRIVLLFLGVLAVNFAAPHFVSIKGAAAILPITSLILVFDVLREFGFAFNRALERMEREAGLYLLTNLGIVIFGFILIRLSPTAKSFTYGYAAGTGVGMIATFFVLKENFKKIFAGFTPALVKKILYSGWPFAITGLLGSLMINTDILIIGAMRSAEEVGFYSAAQRIVQLLYLLPSILAVSIMPTFARLALNDDRKLKRILEHALGLMFLVAIPAALGGFILGPEIIKLVFGGGYALATRSFQILMLTIMIDFPAVILSNAIFAYDKQRTLIVYGAIGGILNVILDLILIPPFGITGSAYATLIAQFASNIYLRRRMKKINYFRVLPYLKKVIPASIVMAASAALFSALGVNVLAAIAVSVLIYFGILYALNEPLFHEIKVILRGAASVAPVTSESVSL